MIHFLRHITGVDNVSGSWYAWWSGFFGDVGLLAAIILGWRRLNCHAKGCPRMGLHRVDGTHYVTCRRHHPEHDGTGKATALQIAMHHRARR